DALCSPVVLIIRRGRAQGVAPTISRFPWKDGKSFSCSPPILPETSKLRKMVQWRHYDTTTPTSQEV
ncbi:MAG TPA: hypothetical protein VFQ30_04900, partial [Ktedonobacteraceae bacterium]|nr:hypothetical protein [Ktedonobacteraceae bacterium]